MHCEWLAQLDPRPIAARLPLVDRVLSCSDFVTRATQRRFPDHAHKCYTLYNGVDTSRFGPAPPSTPSDRAAHRLLFVGRLSPEKGVHVLLEAFAAVAQQRSDVSLELIGPSHPAPKDYIVPVSDDPVVRALGPLFDGDYRGHLESLCPNPVRRRVTFIDNLPQAELVDRYRSGDILLFPSVWDEPFGMPLIEAMACGLPVIATRSGGMPEIIKDQQTGLLVDRADASGLADAIVRLLDDPQHRAKMGQAGRDRVLERFTWDHIAADLRNHYRQVAGNPL
jgi:glycosyltransferase involved in cell wall biosynthesis